MGRAQPLTTMAPLPFHPQRSLSAQLFWRFLFLSLPALIIGCAVLSYAALEQLRNLAAANLAAIAADRANKIEAYARGTLRDIESLAAQPYMAGLADGTTPDPQRAALLAYLRDVRGYRNVFLFSPSGKLIFSQDAGDAPTAELLRTIDRTRTLMSAEISDYTLDRATGTPAVYVAAPIFGPGGAISGMVAGHLRNEEIYRVVNDYGGLGRTGETVIAQNDGNRVVVVAPLRDQPDAAFKLSFPATDAPAAMAAAVEGTRLQGVSKDYRGEEVLAVSRYLPSLGWGLVVKIDYGEIFAPAEHLLQGMIIGGCVLVLLLALGASAAAQSLNQPLRVLTQAARRIEEGDLSARAGLDRRADEFGFLGHAFDGMAGRIQEATESLRETNASLEQKVAERTTDLQAKTVEAERANHAKSEFLANMSHELRTPLNGILGYAQILQNLPALPEKAVAGLRVIRQSGEHLLTLINDILDLAKIEADKIDLVPTDFHLREFLRGPVDIFQVRAEQKGIGFEVELALDLPVAIRADEKRLRQVLINLLGNAVKFTDRGSVRFRVTLWQGNVRFDVKDTGIGIPPSKFSQLFKPFSQVSDAQRNAEGTGLGLALSQRLVQLMGGKIEVESEFNKGSTFWFALDLASRETALLPRIQAAPTAWITGYAGRRRKLLIADDNPVNRGLLVDMLAPLGFDIVEAVDGRQALDLLAKEKPDLALTDISMPVLDGLQFIQYARQIEACRVIPIVPVSASVSEAEIARCRALGCPDFLAKPVEYGRVLDCLRRCLGLEWTGAGSAPPAAVEPEAAAVENGHSPPLPADEATHFVDLARRGDLRELAAAAVALGEADPAYAPFVHRLQKLCEGFRVRQIRQLIEEHTPHE
jgi:signal transduction histidine kinase/DNA-binding NarL/FixJ family response regulator